MPRIVIISPSVRNGRNSHRAALYLYNFIGENNLADVEILDLLKYDFPLFHERLVFQEYPLPSAVEFAGKVRKADGVIIVSPEYNGGLIASLKNAIDLLTDEWRHKPVAFVPVSDGNFGGSQVIISLQFSLWKLRAVNVPGPLRIPNILSALDESGIPADKSGMAKKANALLRDLMWHIESLKRFT